jgi:sucrose-6-phosphate hydrolase SacC (GH32 family)
LPVNNDSGSIKWIITGASDTYIVGNLDKGYFTKEQDTKYFQHGNKISYAAQTFSNIEDEKHRVKIAWDRMTFPDSPFNCQMGFPCELSLKKFDEEYYLCGSPVNEIKQLYLNTNEYFDISLSDDKPFKKYLNNKAYDIYLEAPYKENNDFSIDIFGINIKCNFMENQIICIDKKAPLSLRKDKITLRFIIDTAGIELYINDGLFYVVSNFICDYNINYITLSSSQNAVINKLSLSELSDIW